MQGDISMHPDILCTGWPGTVVIGRRAKDERVEIRVLMETGPPCDQSLPFGE